MAPHAAASQRSSAAVEEPHEEQAVATQRRPAFFMRDAGARPTPCAIQEDRGGCTRDWHPGRRAAAASCRSSARSHAGWGVATRACPSPSPVALDPDGPASTRHPGHTWGGRAAIFPRWRGGGARSLRFGAAWGCALSSFLCVVVLVVGSLLLPISFAA